MTTARGGGAKDKQLHELVSQALESELGGAEVYETAQRCVRHDELASEFEEHHQQTKRHAEIVRGLLASLGLDEAAEPPGRKVVHHLGKSLAKAMETALAIDSPETAELVAAERVVLAQTKDHLNWELLADAAGHLQGAAYRALEEAVREVESEEGEHLYHSTGRCRELGMASPGLPAVLPPPEEQKHVKTAIGAARAKKARESMA